MDLIDDDGAGAGPGNTPEFTVSDLSGAIKKTLEGAFGRVRVRGEIGRVMHARSGHYYYDLKDDRNVIACTTWKGQAARLGMIPEEGMEVIATGRLSTFGPQSKYNLNVDSLEVAGAGALMAMLEKRRQKLQAEGLFATERKQPIPFLPEIIGVVTSPSGAVIRDILHRLRDRFPRKVLIWPVAVQGANAAPEVTRAIEGFNRLTPGGALPRPDLIIVARGGGSVEDLWGFNEESVVRAAAASDIPLISAVGHETDTTLIDYAADRRAPTPTAAAEMAVPVRLDLLAAVDGYGGRMRSALRDRLAQRRQRLADLSRALPRPERLIETPRQRLDRLSDRLDAALSAPVQRGRARLADLSGALRPGALRQRIEAKRQSADNWATRLDPALRRKVAEARRDLIGQSQRLTPAPLRRDFARQGEGLQKLAARLAPAIHARLHGLAQQVEAVDRTRRSLGYDQTLARGYAVIRAGSEVLTDKAMVQGQDRLEIEFRDGRQVVTPLGGAPVKPKRAKPSAPDQGSLFDGD